MAKWKVYGNTWFVTEVEADTEDEATLAGLTKLMDCETVAFNIQYHESELVSA